MGFVWGNTDGVTPRKSVNASDSLDYSYGTLGIGNPLTSTGTDDRSLAEVSAEGDDEAASPPLSEMPTPIMTKPSTTTSSPSLTPRSGGEEHEDPQKPVDWSKLRKERQQLEHVRRKLNEEERKIRNREKHMRDEQREWEEESINLQLENCLLKEKLLAREDELKMRGISAKRKREEANDPALEEDKDECLEKRRRTDSDVKTTPELDNDSDHHHLASEALPSPSASDNKEAEAPASEKVAENQEAAGPTNLWALLLALEGHLRLLVGGQKAISAHQKAILAAAKADRDDAANTPKSANDDEEGAAVGSQNCSSPANHTAAGQEGTKEKEASVIEC